MRMSRNPEHREEIMSAVLTDEQIGKLVAAGFKRWQKGGHDRMYINAEELGLEWGEYKTGNISWARWQGNHISNRQAREIRDAGGTYLDLNTGNIAGGNDTTRQRALTIAREALNLN